MTPNTLLIGPIDTTAEVQLVLDFLKARQLLSQNLMINAEQLKNDWLTQVQQKHRRQYQGDIDDPVEIRMFLEFLVQKGIILNQSPIDTPDEIRKYTEELIQNIIAELKENGLIGFQPGSNAPEAGPKAGPKGKSPR